MGNDDTPLHMNVPATAFLDFGALVRNLPAAIHPGWLAPLGPRAPLNRGLHTWRHWAAYLEIPPVTLEELAAPIGGLVLIPPDAAKRVQALRALRNRLCQVRRAIAPQQRIHLLQCVGQAGLTALLGCTEPAMRGGIGVREPLPDAETLAYEGLHLLQRDGGAPAGAVSRLLRLRMAPNVSGSLAVSEAPAGRELATWAFTSSAVPLGS